MVQDLGPAASWRMPMRTRTMLWPLRRGIGSFADGVNHVFLGCPRQDYLAGASGGFWFGEIFRLGVMGQSVRGFGRGSEGQTSLVVFLGIRRHTILC
jgi:hypothetical protein